MEKCKRLVGEGWSLRLRKRKSGLYLYMRKTINGRRVEKYVSKITEEDEKRLRELGLLGKRSKSYRVKTSKKPRASTTINTTTQPQPPARGQDVSTMRSAEVRPHEGGLDVGFHGLVFVLRPVVDVGGLRGRGFVFRSVDGVWVREFCVLGRRVRVVVSRRGRVSVFVGCSGNPVSAGEFPRFVEGLFGALSGVLGRNVGVRDVVVRSFELNVDGYGDLPGDVSRVELSIHRVGDKVRRELRFSGELPLRLLLEDSFVNELLRVDRGGVNRVRDGLAMVKELALLMSGASYVDRMDKALGDIVEALDKCRVHNLMLHIDMPPKNVPKDYAQKGRFRIKRIMVPWSEPLFPKYIELWVSRKSTTIYVKASTSPIGYEELIKILALIQNELRRIYNRSVNEDEIRVVRIEYNIDKPVDLVFQDMTITVGDVDSEYRSYVKKLPTGEHIEREELVKRNNGTFSDLIEEFRARIGIGKTLSEIKKDLELIKGSLPRQRIEAEQLSEAVATKLANLIYLTSEKWGNRFELALRELGTKLSEALRPVFLRLQQLERENQELRRKLEELTSVESSIKFDDLPKDLRDFLKVLERDGYVRLTNTRIAYGDRVWAAIFKRKGNIDGWLNEAAYDYLGKDDNRELFKAVIKAIRFYDNKYSGKPGVPYDKFLEALEKFMEVDGDG